MKEQMRTIHERLKEAWDRQNSYEDAHRIDQSYEVVDKVFLWVRTQKSSIKFGKGDKLPPGFVGPFVILEKFRPVSYRLVFPSSLSRMHNIFHVSILCHYISDPSHVIYLSNLQISEDGFLMSELIRILDRQT